MQHSEGFLKLAEEARRRVREISPKNAREKQLSTGTRLIDVREDHEWMEGHAAGAEHLGRGIIERDIEKTISHKATEVILYCGGGYRSALACDNLQRMGYTNVLSVAGGWKAWKAAGLPIEDGDDA